MNLFSIFKPLAFTMDPENVHDFSMKYFSKYPGISHLFPCAKVSEQLSITDSHTKWSSPVGLAAGFDKNAVAIEFFEKIGFGAVEVGTVTIEPQQGNERPRIWRYPENNSIRNAMGFPNAGSKVILENIKSSNHTCCLGINIGKNKNTSAADTPSEYAKLYEMFAPHGDYIVINISSPNTPGLRNLQTKEAFRDICIAIDEKRKMLSKPLYLKIAPDLNIEDIKDMVELSKEFSLSGIIATNTTIQHSYDKGGVSGAYIRNISRDIRKKVCELTKETKDISVIGVGGIDSFEDILEFWQQGGKMTQVYSSFIFHGPKLLVNIQNDMLRFLKENQLSSIQEYTDRF